MAGSKERDEPHIIYCITNKTNGKKYVGLSKMSLDERWVSHCSAAFCKDTIAKAKLNRDRVILRAIRKYGRDGFIREIVDNAPSLAIAQNLEKQWIKTLNSKNPHGYNLTDGGEGTLGCPMADWHKKAVSDAVSGEKNYWYGKRGLNHHGYGKKLSGSHIEKLKVNNKNNKQITINGVVYRSEQHASECLEVSRVSIKRLVNWVDETKKVQHQFVMFDDVEYCGIKEAARQLNTTKYLLQRRIARGDGLYIDKVWTFESFCDYLRSLQRPMIAVEFKGKKYRSILQLCKDHKIDSAVATRLLRDGEIVEIDEKFYRESHGSKPVEFEGVRYPSKQSFMQDFSISGKEFKRLVDSGDVEVLQK